MFASLAAWRLILPDATCQEVSTNFGTRLRSLLDSFAQFTSLIYPLSTRVDGMRPRFPCSASAEVTSDGSVELTRVTELSHFGCYLETSKQRTPGTRVTIKIMNSGQIFEATATMLYSRPTMGMGVVIREVKSVFQSILEDWLQQSLKQQNQKPSIDNFERE
jgi:hypothetical protein